MWPWLQAKYFTNPIQCLVAGFHRERLAQKNKIPPAPPRPAASKHPRKSSDLLSTRTTTVNIHRVSSGRNCRETIACLRNARATRYHQANFLWLGRHGVLRRQHDVISPVTSKSRCAKRERQSPDCTSDRPAAPATESGSFSHAVTLIPMGILSKLIPRSTSYFWASPLPPASARNASVGPKEMFETNIFQTRFCFLASAASGRDELVVDSDRGFPL
jgi:hypothetical protein